LHILLIYRILRGDSWNFADEICTTLYRGDFQAIDSDDYVGFRIVRTI
jgi:hypothetical protein